MVKVQHIRLINGDELIGIVQQKKNKTVLVDSPLMVTYHGMNGKEYIALIKYLPYSEDTLCEIQKSHILTISDLHEEIEKYYTLSLIAVDQSQDRTLKHIRNANQVMEEQMFNMNQLTSYISPSSNTVN